MDYHCVIKLMPSLRKREILEYTVYIQNKNTDAFQIEVIEKLIDLYCALGTANL